MEPLDPAYLDTLGLAKRWGMSVRTIEGWRRRRMGPAFVRISRLIRYPLENVRSYEAERLRTSTAPKQGGVR